MSELSDFFAWIAALSPWWWAAFGIALGAVEMATMSFFLIWPALAALIMPMILLLAPELSGAAIISIWAVLSVLLTFVGRAYVQRFGDKGEASDRLNNRAQLLVGRAARVVEWANGEGSVEIDGMRWRAVSKAGHVPTDTSVFIESADGMTLTIRIE